MVHCADMNMPPSKAVLWPWTLPALSVARVRRTLGRSFKCELTEG